MLALPYGNPKAPIRLCGEAPGADEDFYGTPFVGESGRILFNGMKIAGFPSVTCKECKGKGYTTDWTEACVPCRGSGRDFSASVYIYNLTMQRPKGNDFTLVTPEEIIAHQAQYVAPAPPGSTTFLVGGKSLDWHFPGYQSVEVWEGSLLLDDQGRRFVPAFHPAYLMRVPTLMATLGNVLHEGFKLHKPFVPIPGRVPRNSPVIFLDTETQGFTGPVNLVGVSHDGLHVEHFNPADPASMADLAALLAQATMIVAHNALFDLTKLREYGFTIEIDKWYDSMLLWHFYQPDLPKGLDDMCKFVLAGEMCYHKGLGREDSTRWLHACTEQWERRAPNNGGFPTREMFYNAIDVAAMGKAWFLVMADVKREGRWEYFEKGVMPAGRTFWEIEQGGMRIDLKALAEWRETLKVRVADCTEKLLAHPLVTAALSRRTVVSGNSLDRLQTMHEEELLVLNTPRREAEAALAELKRLKALTPKKSEARATLTAQIETFKLPRIIKKTQYTKALQKLRKADPSAGVLKFSVSKKTGLAASLTTAEKLWLCYEGLGLPKQYEERKLKYGRKRKTLSVNKKAMERLLALWSVSEAKREVVVLMKDLQHWSHWLSNFASLEVESNGYIYPRIQIRTATLRAASGADDDEKGGDSPTNAQNWPHDMRNVVIPDVGQVLLQWDYSNQEWLANLWLAGDFEGYQRALAGEDRHSKGAVALAQWRGKQRTLDNYSKESQEANPEYYEERREAKTLNFGLAYGMGPDKLARTYGIGVGKKKKEAVALAKQIITVLQSAYPKVTKWQDDVLLPSARKNKYLMTPFGAKRYFHRIGKDGSLINRAKAYTASTSGAGMMHYRMPPLQRLLKAHGGRLITSTHDSFAGSAPPELAQMLLDKGQAILEAPFAEMGGFVCKVKGAIGQNWREV